MERKLVNSVQELREICLSKEGRYFDFFISLAGGLARSSKQISYTSQDNLFCVINEIDFTFQDDLSEEQLGTETNIVDAIEQKAFYQYL